MVMETVLEEEDWLQEEEEDWLQEEEEDWLQEGLGSDPTFCKKTFFSESMGMV
jgi:hypothetical protein